MKIFFSIVLLLQSVKMTEDFFPLEVGNQWAYEVFNETGQKVGQLDFTVNDRTIVNGRSLYVLSSFPFGGELSVPARTIGYDRETRQFVRVAGDQILPLFPGDEASSVILQSDTTGIPQKFSLRSGTMTLVFQRGVGIVEARFQTAEGRRIATIAGTSVGRKNVTTATPSTVPAAAPSTSPLPAPAAAPMPPTTISPVTAENPALVVSAQKTPTGLKLELLAINSTGKLLPFRFTSSKNYDFVITDTATGREVWRWSNDMMFGQVMRSDSIRGNSRWTFSEEWNLRDNDRNRVPPGRYRLVGILASQPPIESKPVMIEVP